MRGGGLQEVPANYSDFTFKILVFWISGHVEVVAIRDLYNADLI